MLLYTCLVCGRISGSPLKQSICVPLSRHRFENLRSDYMSRCWPELRSIAGIRGKIHVHSIHATFWILTKRKSFGENYLHKNYFWLNQKITSAICLYIIKKNLLFNVFFLFIFYLFIRLIISLLVLPFTFLHICIVSLIYAICSPYIES